MKFKSKDIKGVRFSPLTKNNCENAIKHISEVIGVNLRKCAKVTNVTHSTALKVQIEIYSGNVFVFEGEHHGDKFERSEESTNLMDYTINDLLDLVNNNTNRFIMSGSIETHQCDKHVKCQSCGGMGICPTCEGDKQIICSVCKGTKECPACNGTGKYTCEHCDGTGNCPECDGQGYVYCDKCNGRGGFNCRDCNGTGKYHNHHNGRDYECRSCDGTGEYRCRECGGSGTVGCDECDGDGDCTHCEGQGWKDCRACKATGICGKCRGRGKIWCPDCHGNGKCFDCLGSGCQRCKGTDRYQTYKECEVEDEGLKTKNTYLFFQDKNLNNNIGAENFSPEDFNSLEGPELYSGNFYSQINYTIQYSDQEGLKEVISEENLYHTLKTHIDSLKIDDMIVREGENHYVYIDVNLYINLLPITKICMKSDSKEFYILAVGENPKIYYDELPNTWDRLKGFFKLF